MDSPQKRSTSSSTASSEPPQKAARSSSPAADESSWCTQCWKHPDDKCSGDEHRILPLEDAKTEARNAVGEVDLIMESRQKRLDAVEEAGEPTVLKLSVPSGEGEHGLYVEGGSMMIRMAVTGALTKEEKEKVIEAMNGKWLVFELGADALEEREQKKEVAVTSRLDKMCMASVLEKLPLCVVGQTLPPGSILYRHDQACNWGVYDNPCVVNKRLVQLKVRVFGRVTNDFNLRAQRDDRYEHNRYKYGPASEEPVHAIVDDVKFVDRSLMKAHCSPPERDIPW